MRGRKLNAGRITTAPSRAVIKKESPNEGTETQARCCRVLNTHGIKKESPNEGTETFLQFAIVVIQAHIIKKESPNEGTETIATVAVEHKRGGVDIKKESPNEGTETIRLCNC